MIRPKFNHLRKKFFHLCLVAFGSGTVVMSMELIVSRILTPVFGSSTYTWGSLIGLVLTGLNSSLHFLFLHMVMVSMAITHPITPATIQA